MHYQINDSQVSHNRFDDEIIVIHLTLGSYFSLHGSAALIWETMQKHPVNAEELAKLFEQPPEDACSRIQSFLQKLEEHQLIVPGEAQTSTPLSALPAPTSFTNPELEAFDDLQELLLADIIHDTDERGWPHLDESTIPQSDKDPSEAA